MRFNSKELACLAGQTSDHFDKEGVLSVKERQDSLFRKSEVYVERLFRLRGNLLFYFKTKDPSSEVLGVIVLERCLVELDDDDQSLYSFVIVFEGDERGLRLATRTEPERDSWIERLHIAGYECLRIQLESLREQLKARTGRDPIDSGGLAVDGAAADGATDDSTSGTVERESIFEMCLACHGLPEDSSGHLPDTYAMVHYQDSSDQPWVKHSHTEVVERCASPMYLTTISLGGHISTSTRLRVTVYSVKERLTNTMSHIGHAIFTLSNVLTSVNGSLVLRLNSLDSHDVGSLSVTASQTEHITLNSSANAEVSHNNKICRTLSLASEYRKLGMETMLADFAKIFSKTFRFPLNTGGEHQLIVHEYMAESRLTYTLPIQLLKLYADEERNRIELLERIGGLCKSFRDCLPVQEQINWLMLHYNVCQQTIQRFTCLQGSFFKPSTKKGFKEFEFAPTNLHLQRMFVLNSSRQSSACYDVVTVGVFTSCSQKYKHGGLRRLMQQLEQRGSPPPLPTSANDVASARPVQSGILGRATTIADTLAKLSILRKATDAACDALCEAAVLGDMPAITSATTQLTDMARQLIVACEEELVNRGVSDRSTVRSLSAPAPQQPARNTGTNSHMSTDMPWKWSGTDFIKSPNEEPWDMTKLNTQAALMCVMSKVEEMMAAPSTEPSTQWLDKISPLVIKLKRCVEVTCSRASTGLALIALQDCSSNIPLIHTISYRRDIVFSQALTATTAAFITKLSSCAGDETTVRQFMDIGMLIQFESLISCYGDEVGMLEDMDVAMADLANVTFQVQKVREGNYTDVIVSGRRYCYSITVQLTDTIFNSLPSEIREGRILRIVPVVFTIGINEQATMAEKIGDVSFQESMNRRNFELFYAYYVKFADFQKKHGSAETQKTLLSLDVLLQHLSASVMSKKSKNVDVLHMSEEVCLVMNGARLTGCKSAKDRTAMAVTLEQVRLLQREHDLASDVFLHALECFRSEGVRRENTRKNTGTAKYAFNSLQLLSLPKLYRPPAGTYANVET